MKTQSIHRVIFLGVGEDNLCPYTFPGDDVDVKDAHKCDRNSYDEDDDDDDDGDGDDIRKQHPCIRGRRVDYPLSDTSADEYQYDHDRPTEQCQDQNRNLTSNQSIIDLRRLGDSDQRFNQLHEVLRRLTMAIGDHDGLSLVPVVSILIPRLRLFAARAGRTNEIDYDDLTGRWKPVGSTDFLNELDAFWIASCDAKERQQAGGGVPKGTDPMCDASSWYRRMVLRGVAFQREVIRHVGDGSSLELVATNPLGSWNRTLHSSRISSSDLRKDDGNQIINQLHDPRTNEPISVISFWSSDGKTHTSILWYDEAGDDNDDGAHIIVEDVIPRWETRRYLLDQSENGVVNDIHQRSSDVLISESILHYYDHGSAKHSFTSSSTAHHATKGSATVVWTYVRD